MLASKNDGNSYELLLCLFTIFLVILTLDFFLVSLALVQWRGPVQLIDRMSMKLPVRPWWWWKLWQIDYNNDDDNEDDNDDDNEVNNSIRATRGQPKDQMSPGDHKMPNSEKTPTEIRHQLSSPRICLFSWDTWIGFLNGPLKKEAITKTV